MIQIRLACVWCDRDDHDGITSEQLAACGWTDITVVQTYDESVMPCPPAKNAFDWFTHLGWCPECMAFFENRKASNQHKE